MAYEKIPLFFFFFLYSGIPKIVNIKNKKYKKIVKKKLKNGPCQHKTWQKITKKNKKIKNTKIKIKCVGGGGGQFICCLISNTLPQLEQSSLHPSTVLDHRLLLQTTCYNHHLPQHISRKEKTSSYRLGTP